MSFTYYTDSTRRNRALHKAQAEIRRLGLVPRPVGRNPGLDAATLELFVRIQKAVGGHEFDAGRGQAVGSHIRMGGAAFGLSLFVDEVVTVRDPPHRKVWRTTGEPRLLVIGGYEMGFAITEEGAGSRLSVWIDYALPSRGWARWLPALAGLYARWCVRRMVIDAVQHFASTERQSA